MNAPYDESWIYKDFLELDDDDELNMAVEGNMGGATRREQLLHYLSEVSGTGILQKIIDPNTLNYSHLLRFI